MSPILDIEYDKASKIFDLNVFAPMCVVRAFISQLIVSKGSIVNIGSYADVLPIPWQAVYNASKAALRSFTDILRLELLPFNVKVVYVRLLHISFYCMEKYKSDYFIDCRWRHSEQFSQQLGDVASQQNVTLLPCERDPRADYKLRES
jgi:short-subunit dehydrogenase